MMRKIIAQSRKAYDAQPRARAILIAICMGLTLSMPSRAGSRLSGEYQIQPKDHLIVEIAGTSGGYEVEVTERGMISVPFIEDEVSAAGKTPDELALEIKDKLKRYLKNPTVKIRAAGHHSSEPRRDYVPDEKTAIAIAVAVWTPIYGEEKVKSEKPFKATLENGAWTVYGSLPHGYTRGGTVEAKISKDSGCILLITHGK